MPAINPTTPPKETVTAKMSRWAANLQFKDLSADAIYQAKRFLLDSLGCALGGYQQRDVKIALEVLDEIAANPSNAHELQETLREKLTEMQALGLPLPEDLVGLEQYLEDDLDRVERRRRARAGEDDAPAT